MCVTLFVIREPLPNYSCRAADSDREGGNVFGDNRTCSDDRADTDRYSAEDHGRGTYPHVHANVDGIGRLGSSVRHSSGHPDRDAHLIDRVIIAADDLDVHSDEDPVTDLTVDLDNRVRTDGDIVTDGQPMGCGNHGTSADAYFRSKFHVAPNRYFA